MRELVAECHTLAVIACSGHRPRWHTTPRSQADVTVRSLPWPLITLEPTRHIVEERVSREQQLHSKGK